MPSSAEYSKRWTDYWSSVNERDASIVWDVDPEHGVAIDWEGFGPRLTAGLPLVHLGCGHGRQTAYLADHYPSVVGVDVAAPAVERARRHNARPNLRYRVADALSPDDMAALHAELGDCNVYVRGVFHQLAPEDREAMLRGALTLIGARGLLHLLEVRQGAERLLMPLLKRGLISSLKTVLDAGITPTGIDPEELVALLDPERHEVVERGTTLLMRLPLGRLPMRFRVGAWTMDLRARPRA